MQSTCTASARKWPGPQPLRALATERTMPMKWTLLCVSMLLGCHGASATRATPDGAIAADGASGSGEGGAQPGADAAGPTSDAASDGEAGAPMKPPRHTFVYVGGRTQCSKSYPFRAFSLDRQTGALTLIADADLGRQPTMIAKSPDGRFLYTANECGDASGGVTAGSIDRETGIVTQIDHEASEGADIVFTSLAPGGTHLLAASYGGGKAFVFPVAADGTLRAYSDSLSFGGSAQTHSIRVHPNGRWAFAPNKNLDQIAELTFDPAQGTLSTQSFGPFNTAKGAGPRHVALTKQGDRAFVMNELNSTLSSYAISSKGELFEVESASTLPSSFTGTNSGAHVLLSTDGRKVYASNRGHDSIAAFAIAADGTLDLIEHEPTRGRTPRHFDIDDRGELLVVANQDSGSLMVFRLSDTGALEALGDGTAGLAQPNAVAIVNVD